MINISFKDNKSMKYFMLPPNNYSNNYSNNPYYSH